VHAVAHGRRQCAAATVPNSENKTTRQQQLANVATRLRVSSGTKKTMESLLLQRIQIRAFQIGIQIQIQIRPQTSRPPTRSGADLIRLARFSQTGHSRVHFCRAAPDCDKGQIAINRPQRSPEASGREPRGRERGRRVGEGPQSVSGASARPGRAAPLLSASRQRRPEARISPAETLSNRSARERDCI